jgi:hypothetical protein
VASVAVLFEHRLRVLRRCRERHGDAKDERSGH